MSESGGARGDVRGIQGDGGEDRQAGRRWWRGCGMPAMQLLWERGRKTTEGPVGWAAAGLATWAARWLHR